METLLVFLAIAAIQMLVAYSKQKKEAAKKANAPTPEPFQEEEPPEFEFKQKYEFEPKHKPALEQELESDIKPVHVQEVPHSHPHTMIAASAPLKEKKITKYQFDLKDPAQGILWIAILHEPRYKVKWKQR